MLVVDIYGIQNDDDLRFGIASGDRAKGSNWLRVFVVDCGEIALSQATNGRTILVRNNDVQPNRAGRSVSRTLRIGDALQTNRRKQIERSYGKGPSEVAH